MKAIKQTILIIEDDAGLAELISEQIESCGYQTACVQTAANALDWLKVHTAFLMILDYGLPDMNGENFIAELKTKEQPVPPFLVCTGQGDERIAVDMMKLGARDYIIKDSNFLEMIPLFIGKVAKIIENENQLKLTEDALHKSEEKYRRIAENISDIVWACDMQFNIQYVSPSAEKLMGIPVEEYISQPFDKKFTPQSIEKIYAILAQEQEKEKDSNCDKSRTLITEVEHYRGDGTTFWSEMHILFIRDENGKVIGLEGVSRDISERKQAEQELTEKMDELMRFHRLTVGRELTMIELKKEVNELLTEAGKEAKYNIVG